MNITILTYGSRGDVQPFLALAIGLRSAGHEVTLAAPHRFTDFIEQHEIHGYPLAGNPDELSLLFNEAGSNPIRMVMSMQEHVLSIAPDVIRGVRQAVQGADLLIHSFAFTTGAHSIACELGIPDISVQMFPVFAPTRIFPAIGMPFSGSGWLNYFSHWFSTQVFWHAGNAGYYRLRRVAPQDFPVHLSWPFKPTPGRPISPLLFACSPAVLSNPPEWDLPHIHIPGYFFLENPNFHPSETLASFLEAGNPPICITFGSMVNREAERITRAAMEAVTQVHSRAVFLTGWGGWRPNQVPEHILFLDSAPHDWLLPRCKAVVHHGGAGTTGAGLRAGIPSILVPHAADQPFWGNRVAKIGAGPQPIPVRKLTAENLAKAIQESQTEAIRKCAVEISQRIKAENGVARAVAIIEKHVHSFRQVQAVVQAQ